MTHITNPYEAEEQDDVCSKIIIWMFGACSRCKCCKKCVEKLFGQEDPDESFVSQLYSEGSSDEENEDQAFFPIKPRDKFNMLTAAEQQELIFFMWQKLCSKLRGSVYLIQACAFLHKGLYLRGT